MATMVRAVIKPQTLNRLQKYGKVRIGNSVDDLINDALDSLEPKRKAKT